jgi:hypothetical protein
MAPCTIRGLTHGMAHDGHIHHENYEFTGVGGPTPVSAFGRVLDLCSEDLDPMVYDRHTLRTTLSGSILESTNIGGQVPRLPLATAKSSTQEAKHLWFKASSPKEWPWPATSFWRTVRSSMAMGRHPSPAPTPCRSTMWEAWVQQ